MPAPHLVRRRPVAPSSPDSDSDTFAEQETNSNPNSDTDEQLGRPLRQRRAPATSNFEDAGEGDEDDEGEEGLEDDGEEGEGDEMDDAASTSTDANKPGLVGLKEIGNLASWTVSTAKPGNGIEQLRDEDTTLFWQSDGPQPHHINIHFAKRVKIKRMRMYLDFENDESYTPTKMSVLSGTGHHDLVEVTKLDLERPTGWIEVNLDGVHEDGELRTFLIQVAIHANHQNGKDTHVRGLQIFAAEPPAFETGDVPFTSGSMLQEMELR